MMPFSVIFGRAVRVSPGEVTGVAVREPGGELLKPGRTHGELGWTGAEERSIDGVVGSTLSLIAFMGGDFGILP